MADTTQKTIPGVIAYLGMKDAKAAVAYYRKAFDARVVAEMPTPDGKLMHCQLEINGGSFMLADEFPEHGAPFTDFAGFILHLSVADPKAWWQRAVDSDMEVLHSLRVEFWGDYYGQLKDPFGVKWGIVGPADGEPKTA